MIHFEDDIEELQQWDQQVLSLSLPLEQLYIFVGLFFTEMWKLCRYLDCAKLSMTFWMGWPRKACLFLSD